MIIVNDKDIFSVMVSDENGIIIYSVALFNGAKEEYTTENVPDYIIEFINNTDNVITWKWKYKNNISLSKQYINPIIK